MLRLLLPDRLFACSVPESGLSQRGPFLPHSTLAKAAKGFKENVSSCIKVLPIYIILRHTPLLQVIEQAALRVHAPPGRENSGD